MFGNNCPMNMTEIYPLPSQTWDEETETSNAVMRRNKRPGGRNMWVQHGPTVVFSAMVLFTAAMDRMVLEPFRRDLIDGRKVGDLLHATTTPTVPVVESLSSTNNNNNITYSRSMMSQEAAPQVTQANQTPAVPEQTLITTTEPSRACCVHPVSVEDLMKQYTPRYFQGSFFKDDNNTRYDNWLAVAPAKLHGTTCHDQWRRLTLQETRGGFYFGAVLKEIIGKQPQIQFPFSEEPLDKAIPRALFLGDSVSRGAWEVLLSQPSNPAVHLACAPANCYGFDQYRSDDSLSHWLGPCPWDFVQFNVGLHFHPKPNSNWRYEYKREILEVVQKIHQHSPSAKIVIALTTPSPLDTKETYPPDDGSCPHLHKFHKKGFISSMNDVILSFLEGNERIPGLWGINDRYSLMTPNLIEYQKPCDVHYTESGYRRLADQDWRMVVAALNLELEDAAETTMR